MERYIPHKFEEYFNKVFSYKGHDINDTRHSVEQFQLRTGLDIFQYYKLLEKGIDWIIKNKLETTEDRYIFFSKKNGYGIQVHWREDEHSRSGIFHGFSATTLSKDEMKFFTKKDRLLFLENIQSQGYSSQESINIFDKGYARFEFDTELQNKLDECRLEMFVQSGEVNITFELISL